MKYLITYQFQERIEVASVDKCIIKKLQYFTKVLHKMNLKNKDLVLMVVIAKEMQIK